MRRCIGCYASFPQEELLRFTLQDGRVTADSVGRNEGRGFYLCNNEECLEMAIKKKAFNRILKSSVDPETIREAVRNATDSTKEE